MLSGITQQNYLFYVFYVALALHGRARLQPGLHADLVVILILVKSGHSIAYGHNIPLRYSKHRASRCPLHT